MRASGEFIDWQHTNRYEIFAEWRFRYAPGVTHNTEHVFSLCVPEPGPVRIAPDEHLGYRWLPWKEAAEACFSWSNRDAILELPLRFANRFVASIGQADPDEGRGGFRQ
jgi:dATP pyrophosphohydrolase